MGERRTAAHMKQRLDQMLVARGLAESREKARRLILAGEVLVGGQVVTRPAALIESEGDIPLQVKTPERFVSRGGWKLERAFEIFPISAEGRVCLDVGSSTGGFTDCLLQHGARRVYALDVGRGQLDWRLRRDPRVVVMEGVNARYLKAGDLPERPSLATVDVSFISLTKILPAVTTVLDSGADLVTLIKPQFEAGRRYVEKGGVVRDPEVRAAVIESIRRFGVETLGLTWAGECESPLRGPAGNVEWLAWWKKP